MKGKFLTTAILAALLVGSNAMASIARMAVMGGQPLFTAASSAMSATAANGALWYDDDYNVFYNPAYINESKNRISVEKGIEGGFFKSEFENYAYGVYFNRGGTGNAQAAYGVNNVAPGFNPGRWIVNSGAENLNTQRPVDLFIGGDTGIKWGAHVAWAYNRDQLIGTGTATGASFGGAEATNRYWHFDFGAEVMGLEPFIGVTAFSKYQNTGPNPANANLDEVNAGARYKYEAWTPYVAFEKTRASGSSPAATNQSQTRISDFGFGVGHDTKVADGIHIYKNVGIWWAWTQDDLGAAGGTNGGSANTAPNAQQNMQYTDTIVPLNVAIEGEATSWLTLRAGVEYDLFNNRNYANSDTSTGNTDNVTNRSSSGLGNTKFRIGSTVKLGKLHVDSAFGNGAATSTNVATGNTGNLDSTNIGFDSQTFAMLSVGYHW